MSQPYPTKPPIQLPPQAPLPPRRIVTFLHPGAPDGDDILFTLDANDPGGLHHGVAHTACAIVAGNRFDGFLSRDKTGTNIQKAFDDALDGSKYYFFVPHPEDVNPEDDSADASSRSLPYQYPTVPSFWHWRFPHDQLPPAWDNLPIVHDPNPRSAPSALEARDGSCRVTDCRTECDGAHLCPQREDPWYTREHMARYHADQKQRTTSDLTNMIYLRADIHRALDQSKFVFVPKAGKLVVHILYTTQELYGLYHDRELHPCKCLKEFVFARFAWAIFKRVGVFTTPGQSRLMLLVSGQQDVDPATYQMLGFLSGPPPSSRTSSPEKRDQGRRSPKKRDYGQGPGQTYSGQNGDDQWPPAADGKEASLDLLPGTANKRQKQTPSQFPSDAAAAQQPPTPPESESQSESSSCSSSGQPSSHPPLPSLEDELAHIETLEHVLPEEEYRHLRMKVQELYKERLRSDPAGTWEQERQWLDSAVGGPVSSRMFLAFGFDLPDEEFGPYPEPVTGCEQEGEGNIEDREAIAGPGKVDRLTEEMVARLPCDIRTGNNMHNGSTVCSDG